jgi:hypothetical protein
MRNVSVHTSFGSSIKLAHVHLQRLVALQACGVGALQNSVSIDVSSNQVSWPYALLMMMIVVEPSGLICVCVNLAGAAVTAGEAATKPTKARVAATVEKRMVMMMRRVV